ncbi:Uma2 family endonuclease [Candidatus Thiothrix sp. Deng01]|uniref:Uma2 family endonuclease n=1 Tax=Candidatus Thiothrix phosphatis TaxID=3112415 RepID=A0ABU6CSU5_9GAMM|nr:Uma2 family endonuclease [Candidatus Thiothrix sp. Deng01]MEB4589906.1 Uma2 family endonuclease [Candidatus Thiothrix sp. Deng01]
MGAAPKTDSLSPEEYLLGENDRVDGARYEYVNGQVYAMAGVSRNHNRVSGGVFARLFNHLQGSRCEVFQADMKVGIRTQRENRFYYPDVQVSCADEADNYYNSSPCLIVEVLSESTARTDRTEKLEAYRLLSSLQEYVLCSQDSPSVEVYRRRTEWLAERYVAGQNFLLESVGLEMVVDDLYGFLLNNGK